MLNNYPCTCGGDNENCRWCDGTGMVSRPAAEKSKVFLPESHSASPRAQELEQGKKSNRSKICKFCGLRASASHWCKRPKAPNMGDLKSFVRAELRKVRRDAAAAVPVGKASTKPRAKFAALTEESRRGHKLQSRANGLVKACPHCGAQVVGLQQHILTAHPKRKKSKSKSRKQRNEARVPPEMSVPAPTSKERRGYLRVKESPAHSKTDSASSRGPSQSLDASHNHHVFRDHGQFGSHPSHDDMDDESSP